MALPNSYTMKTGAISDYFDAILNAEAPDRFSIKFLEGIGFASSNDRLIIGILKDLGFLNTDGAPQDRYYAFLDKGNAYKVLAEGIKEAYADLFAVNTAAHNLNVESAYNKLRTLFKGEKKDTVIKNIAKTFFALCDIADFTSITAASENVEEKKQHEKFIPPIEVNSGQAPTENSVNVKSLQYHINIVLPDTRDQAVYDAIFKSLRDHLG